MAHDLPCGYAPRDPEPRPASRRAPPLLGAGRGRPLRPEDVPRLPTEALQRLLSIDPDKRRRAAAAVELAARREAPQASRAALGPRGLLGSSSRGLPPPPRAPQMRPPFTTRGTTPARRPGAPRGLLGPGAPRFPAFSYGVPRPGTSTQVRALVEEMRALTPFQEKQIAKIVADTFAGRAYETKPAAGFAPERVDFRPGDGAVRVVWVYVGVPASMVDPKRKFPVGDRAQMVIPPESDQGEWWYGRIRGIDQDVTWGQVRDLRHTSTPAPPGRPMMETADEAVDRSGFKQPAKVRDVLDTHWRDVARHLYARQPVAAEVLDTYPELVRFYGVDAGAHSVADAIAMRDADDSPVDPDVTVHWSVQQGLLLYTRGKESKIIAGIRAVRGRGMGFKWSSNLGAWYRPQSVGVSESTADIDRIAAALRAQGLVVAVERGEAARSLGEANVRRQGHKERRSDVYAGRAERASERATEFESRAEAVVADLPVGAPTRRAERAEARAERLEGKAAEELAYVERAAGASANLGRTAAGYDTTVEITRRDAERRADAFGAMLVRKGKGQIGAAKMTQSKKDNLSEYRLSWRIDYPAAANVGAAVGFDGREIQVNAYDGRSTGTWSNTYANKRVLLRQNVTANTPQEVFDMVMAVLPRYAADASARVEMDPQTFVDELSLYGKRRTASFKEAAGAKQLALFPSGKHYGNPWSSLELVESTSGMWSENYTRWNLVPEEGMRFRLQRSRPAPQTPVGTYPRFAEPRGTQKEIAAVPLDFTGASVAEAWDLMLAAARSIATGQPMVAPKAPKAPRASKAIGATRGAQGAVGRTAADDARAEAEARRVERHERLQPTVRDAQERLAAMRARRQDVEGRNLLEQARTQGHALAFYPTSPSLAAHMAELAMIRPGDRALEPSAGLGALVEELVERGADVTAHELQPERAAYLSATYPPPTRVFVGDFTAQPPDPSYDRVVMNPPFSLPGERQSDAAHVLHAMGFVAPGGRLVALMSPGSAEPSGRRRAALHGALAAWPHHWEPVDAGRFRVSGTDTATVLLVAERPKQNGWRLGRGRSLSRGRAPARKQNAKRVTAAEKARRAQLEADARMLMAAMIDLGEEPAWSYEHDDRGHGVLFVTATAYNDRRITHAVARDDEGPYIRHDARSWRWQPDGRRPSTGGVYASR